MMPGQRKVIAYSAVVALIGMFGLSGWLASDGRFLEAIALVGVTTTLGWFLARIVNRANDTPDQEQQ